MEHTQTKITDFIDIPHPRPPTGPSTHPKDNDGETILSPSSLNVLSKPESEDENTGSGGSVGIVSDSTQEKPITTDGVVLGNNNNSKTNVRSSLVSGHHIKYSCKYIGSQPTKDPNRIVYLSGWKKYIWKGKNYKIIANKRKLEVVLEFDGDGSVVREKLDFCQNTAEDLLRTFAVRQGVKICSDISLQPFSHWVVKSKKTGRELKPLAETKGNERTGPVFSDSSHPGRLELIGRESEKGALGLDYLFIELPSTINAYLQGQTEERQLLKTNLAVMAEILKRLEAKTDG